MSVYLGIEIGGTKLQLGVGSEDAQLIEVCRLDIDPDGRAAGILRQIDQAASRLVDRHRPAAVGIGFGGPVDTQAGRVIRSHQIKGWDNFDLAGWCSRTCGVPVVLGNDCDSAALAEARYGAGRGRRSVFFVTVGTGVGGGYVVDGQVQGAGRPAIAEIGHLRPGLQADRADMTVESLASGWGIAAAAKARIHEDRALRERCGGDPDRLTTKEIACAASQGNALAREVIGHATDVLGWAIAQVITLVAPEVVVVGGGVSLMGDSLFFAPLREAVARYVFPPLVDAYQVVPAALGELVVVHGAIALAAGFAKGRSGTEPCVAFDGP
jgi:glucokinase